jgi:D-tyrosyl-tRNA(Tyr) deacylase
VRHASVTVFPEGSDGSDGEVVGSIGVGLMVLVGVTHDDDEAVARKLAGKLAKLRVLADDDGVMNRSALDAGAEILVVSQFTLYGDTSRGNRPSWLAAARPDHAEPLVALVAKELAGMGLEVATGAFGADMHVDLLNDGPVTVVIDL